MITVNTGHKLTQNIKHEFWTILRPRWMCPYWHGQSVLLWMFGGGEGGDNSCVMIRIISSINVNYFAGDLYHSISPLFHTAHTIDHNWHMADVQFCIYFIFSLHSFGIRVERTAWIEWTKRRLISAHCRWLIKIWWSNIVIIYFAFEIASVISRH